MSEPRKYAMTRIRRGDYLLPSNDLKTLWRVYSYEEDGSLEIDLGGGKYKRVVGEFWACSRRPMPPEGATIDADFMWSDEWEFYSGPLNTRAAAIQEAMGAVGNQRMEVRT